MMVAFVVACILLAAGLEAYYRWKQTTQAWVELCRAYHTSWRVERERALWLRGELNEALRRHQEGVYR